MANNYPKNDKYSGKKWIKRGVIFGVILYALQLTFAPYFCEGLCTKLGYALLPLSLIVGLFHAFSMKRMFEKRGIKSL